MTPQSEEKNYRWNFTFNLLDGAFYWFGSSFISATTIFPLFISKLTPSLIPIGLVSVITSAGWFIPQLFSARVVERITKMKSVIVGWGAILERLPFWLMIISAVLASRHPTLALILFLICLLWFNLGAGIVAPSWMALLEKIFSPEKRGSFLGLTVFVGAGMGMLGSIASAYILESLTFPRSFIILFTIAAFFMTLSWLSLAFVREPIGKHATLDQDWKTYRKDLLHILKVDHNFRRYIISNVLITLGSMGVGFLTVSAIQRFQVSDAVVGLYSLAMLFGQMLGNLLLGRLADKRGNKLSLEISLMASVIAFALAIFMPSPTIYFVVFALVGVNAGSAIGSAMLIVWEFCDSTRVPTYSGLANTTRGIMSLIAPLIATQIASLGYGFLFSLSCALSLAGLLLLHFWVMEPRWQKNANIIKPQLDI